MCTSDAIEWTRRTFGDVEPRWTHIVPEVYRGHAVQTAMWRLGRGEQLSAEERRAVGDILTRAEKKPVRTNVHRWADPYVAAIVEAVATWWELPYTQAEYGPPPSRQDDEVAAEPRSACAVVAAALRPDVGGEAVEKQWRRARKA